jgi:hypothetical protein
VPTLPSGISLWNDLSARLLALVFRKERQTVAAGWSDLAGPIVTPRQHAPE